MANNRRFDNKGILTFVVTIALLIAIGFGLFFGVRAIKSKDNDKVFVTGGNEYKISYIDGDFYARNNVDNEKQSVTMLENSYGLGMTITFTPVAKEGYKVQGIKTNYSPTEMTADENGVVVLSMPAGYDKENLSIMVIYAKE